MFVNNGPVKPKCLPVQNRPAVTHVARKCGTFIHAHTVKEHRHRKGCDLPFTDTVIGNALNEKRYLGVGQNFAFTFTANNFLRQHMLSPRGRRSIISAITKRNRL